ncbi:MAG TPA: hypothetical protein VMU68_14690 [Acidimicrobiales bacterium]|nr:hypothetical protein [Acidimicrobiales bacterium]
MRDWIRRHDSPGARLDALVIVAVIFVTVWELHPSLVFSNTLITGGDTGSHLAVPAYLKSVGNPFNLTPWDPGWFAGMPAYTYYFVLPDVLAWFGSYIVGFAIAFKLATILGSVLMPITAYMMGRLFKAPRPVPAALAVATLPFLFDASFTIDGGNLFSTMAGEYAFALSLALSLLTIGLFARGVRTGKGYWVSAIALSATLAAHILPWFWAIEAIIIIVIFELLQRRGIGDPNDDDLRGDYARPLRFAFVAGLISVCLSAWWLTSFVTTQKYTNSMGYTNVPVNTVHAIFTELGWFTSTGGAAGDRWVIVLAAIALIVAFWVRDRLGMILTTLAVLSIGAFVFDPQNVIWNERLVPFWYITIHLSAGWLFGYVLARWVKRPANALGRISVQIGETRFSFAHEATSDDAEPEPATPQVQGDRLFGDDVFAASSYKDEIKPVEDDEWRTTRRTARATIIILVLGLLTTVPGLIPPVASALSLNTTGNEVTNWAAYNYSGYQAKPAWPEYHDLMNTMAKVGRQYGCGRAMWEYNVNEGRFGTPEALMLMPYWTNNCIDSMEGLYFESSATTPYHFLDQAELSVGPSNPMVGLPYGGLDVAFGIQHLQMLGVRYYVAYSPATVKQANRDPNLTLIAKTKDWPSPGAQWRIYLIAKSPMVQALTTLPNIVANTTSRIGWLDANTAWWLDPKLWGTVAATTGPSNWPEATSVKTMNMTTTLPKVKVKDIKVGLQSISFHVSKIGVPILVKISYFPRWHAIGATGPYRVSPNLMVVIPTSKNVSMVYGSTSMLTFGNIVTDITSLAGVTALYFYLRRRVLVRRQRVREELAV